ncbi:MAG: hypothetical protein KJO41_11965 [Bacteroidia bacterium]|nr:hypothetical protein [Bacteroidia bacterium]
METGKYLRYAIGEIILVMIGILLTLQVDNLNNQRLKKQLEKTILKQIRVEFIVKPTKMGAVKAAVFNDTCGNNIQFVEEL